jgi:hypothetical protein
MQEISGYRGRCQASPGNIDSLETIFQYSSGLCLVYLDDAYLALTEIASLSNLEASGLQEHGVNNALQCNL